MVGTPELALALGSVTIDGVDHDVVSDAAAREVSLRGLGENAGGPRFIGGGALLGTLVGAVAGRGTGALQVFTKGRSIRVPGETLLTFQLDRPLGIEDYPRR